MTIALAALLAAAAAEPPATADPLLPARSGQLQCHMPDVARKTCRALAGYRPADGGGYSNSATILVAAEPVVTMTTVTPVRVVAGAVCGTIRAEDIAQGTLAVDGANLPADQAGPILGQIATAMAAMIGHEICTRYEPAGGGLLTARATIDGVSRPETQQVLWVRPEDGYRVAP
jgi:hypothetical protein